jgi:hypothetical protein
MAYWNEQFTKKKQKDMFSQKHKKVEHKTPYPIYESVPIPTATAWQERIQIRKKERLFKIIGGIIILFVCISGIYAVLWAAGV